MLVYVISQIICLFGLITFIISMQKYNKKDVLKWQILSFLLYTAQYFLLGAYSGMLIYLVNMTRSIVFYFYENKNRIYVFFIVLFIFISVIIGIILYKNYLDLLPITISIFSILNISQKNVLHIKKGQIVISGLWMIYDIGISSYVASITEIIIIITTLKSILNKNKLLPEKSLIR